MRRRPLDPRPDRDRSIDHLLRQVLRRDEASPAPGPCVDAETVAAWTSRTLAPDEHASVEAHLAGCPRCQQMLATLARTAPETPARAALWERWRLRWLVPLATAATALVVWTALPERAQAPVEDDRPELVIAERAQAPAAPPEETPAAVPEPAAPSATAPPAAPPAGAFSKSEPPAAADAVSPTPPAVPERKAAEAVESTTRVTERRAPAAPGTPPPAESVDRQLADRRDDRPAALAEMMAVAIEIVAPDPSHRWRIIDGMRVEHSTTGGDTWQPVSIDPPAALTAGSSPAPRVCWMVGRQGSVFVTTTGTRFAAVPFVDRSDLVGVAATSADRATVTTADGRTFETTDGGRSWK